MNINIYITLVYFHVKNKNNNLQNMLVVSGSLNGNKDKNS